MKAHLFVVFLSAFIAASSIRAPQPITCSELAIRAHNNHHHHHHHDHQVSSSSRALYKRQHERNSSPRDNTKPHGHSARLPRGMIWSELEAGAGVAEEESFLSQLDQYKAPNLMPTLLNTSPTLHPQSKHNQGK